MGLNVNESVTVLLSGLAMAAVTLSLFDKGWAVIRDRDGSVYFAGLLESELRVPGLNGTFTTTLVNNEELDSRFAGQITALVIFVGLAAGLASVVNIFLVGSGNRDREKGHMLAMQLLAAGGIVLLGACGTYSFMHPSEWEFHDDNEELSTSLAHDRPPAPPPLRASQRR